MNVHVANLKSSALNPTLPEEKRLRAETQLRTIAVDESDPRSGDAKLALRDLPGDAASTENGRSCTETVQDDPTYRSNEAAVDALVEDFKTLTAEEVFGKWRNRRRAEYAQFVADGLTNGQVVARLRELHGPNAAMHYGMLTHQADECRKEQSRSNVYRYHLPLVYALLKKTPDYDRPARELAEATLAEYLPYKWMGLELFSEMQEVLKSDPSKSSFEQVSIAMRVAPHIDRWRKIKTDWEAANGPTGECLADVLYYASTDHPEYAKVTA